MQYSDRILSTPSSFIRNILKVTESPDVISFAGGLPNPISFPIEALKESAVRAIESHGSAMFQYATTDGDPLLREYIAHRYAAKHGLQFSPDDILITNGSQQALELLGAVLLNKGDGVILEEPGYLGAIQAFSLCEPVFHPVPLESDGLNIEELEAALRAARVKCLYTVPNLQNPTGLTYSSQNRKAILDLVSRCDIALIEDDPYGDLRFEGEALPYIGAGVYDNSVLLGTFSKTVTPGIRIGYLATKNKTLRKHLVTAKQGSDLHTSIFAQHLICDYLLHNDYESHIQTIIELYREQAAAMLDAMAQYFPPCVSYTRPAGGMFVWAALKEGDSAMDLFPRAMEQKVAFVPGDPFYTSRTNVNTMRLNYTNATPELIREGIRRLASVL